MARAVATKTEKKKRTRRSPEERIADLERQITEVKEREASRAAKQPPEGKAFADAVRAVNNAIEADDQAMVGKLLPALGELEGRPEQG